MSEQQELVLLLRQLLEAVRTIRLVVCVGLLALLMQGRWETVGANLLRLLQGPPV